MIKDFDGWGKLKKELNDRGECPTFQVRDIWWCSIGTNIGYEEDGKGRLFNRPVLVLRKFNKHMFLGVPLTTRIKDNPFYLKIKIHQKEQCVMISHLRLYESKRLTHHFAKLDNYQFTVVKEAVKNML